MADGEKAAASVGATQGAVAPIAVQHASRFVVAVSAQEILLTFGVQRVSPQPGEAYPQPNVTEWLVTFAMSPVTMDQLIDALKNSKEQYENKFGKIPRDPAGVTIFGGEPKK
jgi:hypothetical protein